MALGTACSAGAGVDNAGAWTQHVAVRLPPTTTVRGADPQLPSVASDTEDLPNVPPPPGAKPLPPPPKPPVIPSDILFATDSAVLKPTANQYLASLARQILDRYPNSSIRIVGHTDSRGASDYNYALSLDRARAVMAAFAAAGFPAGRMTAVGAGEGRPVISDTDASGRFIQSAGAKNRRVEVQILP